MFRRRTWASIATYVRDLIPQRVEIDDDTV
jgi:hypothetical protein